MAVPDNADHRIERPDLTIHRQRAARQWRPGSPELLAQKVRRVAASLTGAALLIADRATSTALAP
jgi:hypothetical protein